jgi:hypothetical protein
MSKKYKLNNINFISYSSQEQLIKLNYKKYNEIFSPCIRMVRIVKSILIINKKTLNKHDCRLLDEVNYTYNKMTQSKGTYVF